MRWLCKLPARLRTRLGIDDDSAIGTRRLELGPGSRPQPGYVHADTDPWASHVELRLKGRRLPLSDGWADEILAVHVLEHVAPAEMVPTLAEWRRCLRPGGFLQVHVPDSARLAQQFVDERDLGRKWAVMGALLGMYANPKVDRPTLLSQPADHQVLFDAQILEWALREAGFARLENLTGSVTDVHTEGWRELVPDLSLVVRAYK
jgi:hypothetical protein